MKLTLNTMKLIAGMITGDAERFPYRTHKNLEQMFLHFKSDQDTTTFSGTRIDYAFDWLSSLNKTEIIDQIIEHVFEPRNFTHGHVEFEVALSMLNKYLAYDNYHLVKSGNVYKIEALQTQKTIVPIEITFADKFNQSNIDKNIEKCKTKLQSGDFEGAITNARTLLESTFINIENELNITTQENDGDLIKQYKRIQKLLNLEPGRKDIEKPLKQVLSGLNSTIHGLSSLRNKMSDAHATNYKPSRHHARLVVNSSFAVTQFLFDSMIYQKERNILK